MTWCKADPLMVFSSSLFPFQNWGFWRRVLESEQRKLKTVSAPYFFSTQMRHTTTIMASLLSSLLMRIFCFTDVFATMRWCISLSILCCVHKTNPVSKFGFINKLSCECFVHLCCTSYLANKSLASFFAWPQFDLCLHDNFVECCASRGVLYTTVLEPHRKF